MKATTALSHHEFRTALSQCILLSLERLNNLGHGIFVMVNEGDGNGRAAKNVTAIRALFTDDDQGSADVQGATGLQPSLVIVSKRGKHSYLRVKPGAPLDAFGSAQKALAVKCGTDPKICDLPRVMRLPGFFHVKDPADPFLVRIEQTCESAVYAVEETMAVLGAASDNATETAPPAERRRSTSSAYEQARAFVAKQPAAVEGEAGDNATFSHCCALVLGFDLTDDDALELLAEWNRRCVPPWSEADLSDKLDYARKYGTEEVGGRVRSEEIAYVVPLEKYLLRDAQGAWALDSPVAQTAAKKYLRDRGFTADEIKSIICSDEIIFAYGFDCVAGKPPVFVRGDRLWLNNFMPGGVEPKAGDFPRIRRIIDTVTANDASGAEWLLDWMAQKVQNPDARNQTAVVLHGEQGTGKTTLVFLLAEMIGPRNAVSISQSELESSFNSIFASKLLVIADEVVNRDNIKDTASSLKKYVTDPKVVVNTKSVKQYEIENRMSWWFTSNELTPVKVEGDGDRRYTVFRCNELPSADYTQMLSSLYAFGKHFAPDFIEEVAAFKHALTNRTVNRTLIGKPYKNAARDELISTSRPPVEHFMDELEAKGVEAVIGDATEGYGPALGPWELHDGVRTSVLYKAYDRYCQQHGYKALSDSNFGSALRRRFPRCGKKRASSGDRSYYYAGLPLKPATSHTS